MISDKIRTAAHLLRRRMSEEAGPVTLDPITLAALVAHLDQAAHDVALLEAHAVIRARRPAPISVREESLLGLVYCAAMQLPELRSLGLVRAAGRIVGAPPEVAS